MKKRMYSPSVLGRRGFLGTSIGLGVLPWLVPERLVGASPLRSRRRLVVFFTPNEPINTDYWMPKGGSGSEYDLEGTTFPAPFDILNDYKRDLLMIGGMRLDSGNHAGVTSLLTGHGWHDQDTAGGVDISMDQLLAERLGEEPLLLGVGKRLKGVRGSSRISYLGTNRPVGPILPPGEAFAEAFGTLPDAGDDSGNKLLAQRRSVLDVNAKQLMVLRSRLKGDASINLDHHLEEVRKLELKLSGNGGDLSECNGTAPGAIDHSDPRQATQVARMQMDIMIEALRCGARNVGVLQLGDGGQMFPQPIYAPEYNVDINLNEHSDLAHDWEAQITNRVKVETVYYHLFAEFLDKMKAATDVDGSSLLDSTVVLWCKALGLRHGSREMLFMLAGGQNSGITKLGRYMDGTDRYSNDLLLSCLGLMGQDDEAFGDASLTTGPFTV